MSSPLEYVPGDEPGEAWHLTLNKDQLTTLRYVVGKCLWQTIESGHAPKGFLLAHGALSTSKVEKVPLTLKLPGDWLDEIGEMLDNFVENTRRTADEVRLLFPITPHMIPFAKESFHHLARAEYIAGIIHAEKEFLDARGSGVDWDSLDLTNLED